MGQQARERESELPSLLVAGQMRPKVVAVDAALRRTERNTGPEALDRRSPRVSVAAGLQAHVCRHMCVAAVLFYVTNCLGSTRWQAAASRARAGAWRGETAGRVQSWRDGEAEGARGKVAS